ncbi:MAG: class I SAM-dependent methyltransferase [Synechococcus sp. ChBW.bin.23]
MKRCPEPELMNAPDQVIAYAEADFSASDYSVIEGLLELIASSCSTLPPASLILDLGCGPGNISERLASCWPSSDVIGIDGAPSMISMANQRLFACRPPIQNLKYQRVDLNHCCLVDLQHIRGASVIVSNSLLHHLHNPQTLWASVKQLAAPNAFMLHRDLRRPSNEQEVDALCDRYVSDAPSILHRDFRASLMAAFTAVEVCDQLDLAGLSQFTVKEIGDRYLEVSGRW